MAVTSIWPIKGRVDQVINYTRNPGKTTEQVHGELAAMHSINGVVEYVANDMKTEQRFYVSCLNCKEADAAAQFMATKRLWGKANGRVCYHGYQSFGANEVTAETAHEIGVRLAKELWGERFEVVLATHCNTGHYHNHFVINSVSLIDGNKFYNSPADYARMREVSDRLCREFSISVIENPGGRGKNYGEWLAEKNGKPTHKGSIRADIDRAIVASTTERDFVRLMTEMGYEFKTRGKGGAPLKYPALKPPDAKGYFRFHKLGDGYALDQVKERILQNVRKQIPFPEVKQKLPQRYRYRGKFQQHQRITGLRALYLRYCYELHIIVKRPTSVKRVSFLLREDVVKLDRLIAQTRFLGRTGIETMSELTSYRESLEAQMVAFNEQRLALRNQLRRLTRQGDAQAADTVRSQISDISWKLKSLRYDKALCEGIEERSGQVKEKLLLLKRQQEIERKERSDHELFRRRGGTGRTDDPGGR